MDGLFISWRGALRQAQGPHTKILFKDKNDQPLAFIWMRGSGTEPVFRIMCDVKGNKPEEEKELLEWETKLIKEAD